MFVCAYGLPNGPGSSKEGGRGCSVILMSEEGAVREEKKEEGKMGGCPV